MSKKLIQKYDVPAPRYTSYPTVPYWQDNPPSQHLWVERVRDSFSKSKEISLYIHLPYCENLCTYCGCNKRITKRHDVEIPYINAILTEWLHYLQIFEDKPVIKELHLGGGTPTFFSPENLDFLLKELLSQAHIPNESEFSFEAHPSSTTLAHLATLKVHGFKRISVGVQDFDQHILKTINRKQTYEQIEQVTFWARELGYTSINYDLIFGLPHQTTDNIKSNFEYLEVLRPDRIAFYSYAHVPWVSPSQRAYSEEDLPKGQAKRTLYELGRELLEKAGYKEIGLDHFTLPTDDLYTALQTGTLHRNFMGYTPNYTSLSIGLGASAISDSWDGYVQNEKKIETYKARVGAGDFPFFRGHLLTEEDKIIRKHILNLMCRFETDWMDKESQCPALDNSFNRLEELEKDGLIIRQPFCLKVTELGRPFIRNICMALDAHYWEKQPQEKLFSKAI